MPSPWPLTMPLPRPCHPNAIACAMSSPLLRHCLDHVMSMPSPVPCHCLGYATVVRIDSILQWRPNAGTTLSTQILSEVSQCIETINGVKEGRWKNTVCFYRPILKDQAKAVEFPKDFKGISLQEQPDMYYMIIRQQRLIMEAESSMQEIMEKLQSYKTRIAISFEGFQYRLGDFRLRVGKVSPVNSENLRGIMMEMEYLPISSWETSPQIMNEFFDILKETLEGRSLPGHFVHVEPNFSEYGLSDQYTSQHTAVQYASFMAQMISTVNDAEKDSDIDPQEAHQTLEIAEAENLMTSVPKAKKEEQEQEFVLSNQSSGFPLLSRPSSSSTTTVVVANGHPPFRKVTRPAFRSKVVYHCYGADRFTTSAPLSDIGTLFKLIHRWRKREH
ncbi:Mediator of RNA polymerase II transcription subunit 20b [Capsicum baccatum]|uniref:Mediator of RNA polymerase II transcription subunit 20 n=1 Tax=Capsicum baccatum TaxID=33114 RepID=A0A2G2X402_CAPBA|nr:Mediator of RNA polymerase II transcription subunit 20b [Capsicum baccatum]